MNPLHRVMAHGHSDPIAGPSPVNQRQRESVTGSTVVMQRRSEGASGFSGVIQPRTERVTRSRVVS